MKNKNKKPVAFAFVDATNIIYGAGDSGWRMDFAKLINYLRTRFGVSRVLYFAGLDQENLKQLKFYEKLQQFGYELRLVPVKTFKDGRKKADVDSRMTFEMMLMKDSFNKAVVFTGDGDFYWVLEYFQQTKQQVKLMAHGHSTARELKKLFRHEFTDLTSLRWMLEEKQRKNGTDAKAESVPRGYGKNISKNKKFVKRQIKKTC